jgi:hypothetical protein
MKLTQPRVVSTTAAPHGNAGHYRRTVATNVQYKMRGSIIATRIPAMRYGQAKGCNSG